jgi:hypothetical protein
MTKQEKHAACAVDVVLAAAAAALGLALAAGYAAWRAATGDGSRVGSFGEAMLFPGTLIVAAVAAMVWLGWKANIDG